MLFLQATFYGLLASAATVIADYLSFRVRCNAGKESPAPPDATAEDEGTRLLDWILEAKRQAWVNEIEQMLEKRKGGTE